MLKKARVIALYLPQFHPIPENDQWWGCGFTEWTNVVKAKPLFRGHYQPCIPADLGYYDLRVPETRIAQAELAKEYGIEAFCYYHYWFAGKRLLDRPFNEVLTSGKPDIPFCLCWANHSWTGVWHGCPDRILIEQTYPGMKDYETHFFTLLRAFTDDRYLKVDGKPIFLIFNPIELPDVKRALDFWRDLAKSVGLPGLFLVGISHNAPRWNPHEFGFDASVQERLPSLNGNISWHFPVRKFCKAVFHRKCRLTIYSYKNILKSFIRSAKPNYRDFPCLIPNWDNTPRAGLNGLVLHDSTPELFRIQVRRALEFVACESPEYRLIFLKAWNEWAEGNYVEPDHRFGRGYLQVIKEELSNSHHNLPAACCSDSRPFPQLS